MRVGGQLPGPSHLQGLLLVHLVLLRIVAQLLCDLRADSNKKICLEFHALAGSCFEHTVLLTSPSTHIAVEQTMGSTSWLGYSQQARVQQAEGKGKGQRAKGKGKGQRAKGKGQRAKGKGQRAKGKGQRAKGKGKIANGNGCDVSGSSAMHMHEFRMGQRTCMEQNFGPHMEQKCAVLAGSCGSVASWNRRAVTGSRLRLNWSYLHAPREPS